MIAATSWKDYYKSRERVQETAYINLGLLSLKRCVVAMLEQAAVMQAEKEKDSDAIKKENRIPFYDSKLTQLMRQPFLARNMACIICAGPEDANAVESIGMIVSI